jgi:diacylglycerol kinase (ATP)
VYERVGREQSRPIVCLELGLDRILRACVNTWNGLRAAARTEAAFRQELAAIVIAVPLAFVIAAEPWKRLLLILVVLIVMAVELLNTAIEKLADHVTAAHHPEIGRVKDIGSAAVGVALLIAGLAWLLALAEWAGLVG